MISDFVDFAYFFSESVISQIGFDIFAEQEGGYLPTALFLSSMVLGFVVFLIRRALYNR